MKVKVVRNNNRDRTETADMASGLIWIRRLLPASLIFVLALPGTGGVEWGAVLPLLALQIAIFIYVFGKWAKNLTESAAGVE